MTVQTFPSLAGGVGTGDTMGSCQREREVNFRCAVLGQLADVHRNLHREHVGSIEASIPIRLA